MLNNSQVCAVLPAKDIEASKKFYIEKLGLKVLMDMGEMVIFEAGKGTVISIYKKPDAVESNFTQAGFNVENFDEVMKELTDRGVEFEKYDMPNLKTDENGVMVYGDSKSAWFKDPSGNIIALTAMKK